MVEHRLDGTRGLVLDDFALGTELRHTGDV